jgi:hypothetical protein
MGGYGRSTYSMLETNDNYLKLTTWEVDRPEKLVDEFLITKTSIVPDQGDDSDNDQQENAQTGNQSSTVIVTPTDIGNGNNEKGCKGSIGAIPLFVVLPVAILALRKRY